MQTQPPQAVINTISCGVLHNIGILRGDIIPTPDDIEDDDPVAIPHVYEDTNMRDHVVQTFFS